MKSITCSRCRAVMVGAVATIMHYERLNGHGSPCDRRAARRGVTWS